MVVWILALAAALFSLGSMAASAQTLGLGQFEADNAECTIVLEDRSSAGWSGWQRNFGNGYADEFHFYDGRLDEMPSVLDVTVFTDGSVVEGTRWCYRVDGSLATLAIGTSSPDMAEGGDGQYITREGRLYFDESGEIVAVRGWLNNSLGESIGAIDSTEHQVARGCNPVDLRLTAADAQAELDAILGTLEGQYPSYEPNEFDWCAVADFGP